MQQMLDLISQDDSKKDPDLDIQLAQEALNNMDTPLYEVRPSQW
jgi:hypothetical protein